MKRLKLIIINLSVLLLISMPVFAEIDSNAGNYSTFGMIFKLILYIFIFILIILFALYGTRFVAKNFNVNAKSRYINIIDSISISTSMRIIIFEINSMIYIIAISNDKVELIDKYALDKFNIIENEDLEHNMSMKDNPLIEKIMKFIDKEDRNEKKY